MKIKVMANLTFALLFLIVGSSICTYVPELNQIQPIETIESLELSNVNDTRIVIGSYMVNRKSRSDLVYPVFTLDELDKLNITIKLGDIKYVDTISDQSGQNTMTGLERHFEASLIYGPYDAYDKVFGRIDQNMRIYEKRTSESRPFNYSRIWSPHAFLNNHYCITEFVNVTSKAGYKYWDISIGNIKVRSFSESEVKKIRMFSSKTEWRGSDVYWSFAGYITEDLEIHFTRLS